MNEARVADELRGSYAEKVLLYINDQGGHVDRDLLVEFTGDPQAASEMVQELEDLGLAKINSMAADVKLTSSGQRVADRIQKSVRSGPRRLDDVQRAVLARLDGIDDGSAPDVYSFLDAPEDELEVPMTSQELRDAVELLMADGHIEGRAIGGAIHAYIRPLGRAALRSGEPISQFGTSNHTTYQSHNVTFGDNAQVGGVMSGGQHNVQIVEQSMTPDVKADVASRLAHLTSLARELGDTPGAAEVLDALAVMDSEIVKPEPKPGVFKRAASGALIAGAKAAATSAGPRLIQGLAELVKIFTD